MLQDKCYDYNYGRVTNFQSTRNYHTLNTNVILSGDENFTDEDNINIFTAVQIFTKDTRRFAS